MSCGFYSGSDQSFASCDDDSTQVNAGLSFNEVTSLLQKSKNTRILTLPELWKIYREFEGLNNKTMLQSLSSPEYVELLHTQIYNKTHVKHGRYGIFERASIPEARPGLIRPTWCDVNTGFPRQVASANNYEDQSLWRYWSSDADINVATRGHIFIMGQTSLDLKVGPDERTEKLTFRPVYADIPEMKFRIEDDGDHWIRLYIFPRLFSVFDM